MAKRKTPKTAAATKAKTNSRQLVVTMNGSRGDIEKIEELGAARKRRAVSEAEFARFAGSDDLGDVCEALEYAYLAGIKDAFVESDNVLDDAQEQTSPRDSFGETALRAGIRRIVFRRAVRSKLKRAGAHLASNGGSAH